jgi:DNA polymerase-3 subunit delta
LTPQQFLARVKRNEIPPVVLFLGTEAYERRRCREALAAAMPDAEVTQYDLSQSALASVIDDARAMSLFATSRVIVASSAEAVLPRGNSKSEDDDDGGAASGGGAIKQYVKSPTPGVVLLFEATRFDFEGEDKKKLDRVRQFFSAITDTVEFKRHSPDEARQEAQAMLWRAQVPMEPAALEMLVESLGSDVARLATEIEKLASFAEKGKAITEDDIAVLVPDARETTIFVLVSALGRRDRIRALGVLDTLCRDGEYLPLALSFLSTQFRMALVAKESNLRSAQQIQGHFTKAGVPMWGSRAEQVAQTTAKFSKEHLERGMKLIFEADRSLRDARPDDRIVMERFVVELTAV